MDKYMGPVRDQLRLVQKLLDVRKAAIAAKPPGMINRNNQLRHTQAMLGLLSVLRGMAAHDELDWWEDNDDVPF